jgi:hypothetical protein
VIHEVSSSTHSPGILPERFLSFLKATEESKNGVKFEFDSPIPLFPTAKLPFLGIEPRKLSDIPTVSHKWPSISQVQTPEKCGMPERPSFFF